MIYKVRLFLKLFLLFQNLPLRYSAKGIPNWKTDEIRGVCYSPVPKNIIPSQTVWLYDSDMFNSDFQALWGIDTTPGVVSRDDLRYIRNAGFNALHLYDWNPSLRNHVPFLDYAYEMGLGVLVPFSNWFLETAWGNHTTLVSDVIQGVTTSSGEIHPAILGWIVGNEYDETDSLTPIENVIDLLIDIATLDPDPECNRFFTIPSSTQAGYNDNIYPGLGQLLEIRETLLREAPDIYYNRFVNAINPFMPFMDGMTTLILQPYIEMYDSLGEPPRPILFTETGLSQKDKDLRNKYAVGDGTLGQTGMSDLEAEVLVGFLQVIRKTPEGQLFNVTRANLIGYFFFEFQQEDWKGGGGVDMYYGLHSTGDNISPVLPQQVSPPFKCHTLPTVVADKTHYTVNELTPVKAWKTLASLQTNTQYLAAAGEGFNSTELGRINLIGSNLQSMVLNCIVSDWSTFQSCTPYNTFNTCKGFIIQIRTILQQANAFGDNCPTDLSRIVPCVVSDVCASSFFDLTYTRLKIYFAIGGVACVVVVLAVFAFRKLHRQRAVAQSSAGYGAIPAENFA